MTVSLGPFLLGRRRSAAGLSHRQLAARSGVSNAAISHAETGRSAPTVLTVLKLAAALGCTPTALLADADAVDKGEVTSG